MSDERRRAAPAGGLDSLIHDVNSKCASLKGAAALLPKASPAEARELLELMGRQALSLAEAIAGFRDGP